MKRLGKNDAPLRIQYEKGRTAFAMGNLNPPYKLNSMQYREWLRGFNAAYFENLEGPQSETKN